MADLGNDIKKYRAGELTPAEMNALEKRALRDPFIADALAGSESISAQEFAADLIGLQSSISGRIQKRKMLSPWLWTARIAAGLLILAVTGYVIFSLSAARETSHDLALNKAPAQSAPGNTETNSGQEPQPVETEESPKNISKPIERQPAPAPIVAQRSASQSSGNEEAIQVPEETKIEDQSNAEELSVATDAEPMSTKVAPFSPKEIADDKELSMKRKSASVAGAQADVRDHFNAKEGPSKIIRGKVTDAEDGSELPGVNVTIKGSQKGTFTDAEGNYQLTVDDREAALVFSFIGLQEVEVAVNDHDNLNVKMEADVSALSEVVVVGYAPIRDDLDQDPITYQLAEPMGGKKPFKNYLVQNMQYPQAAIDNEVQGKVTVQFTVESNGLLNDFNVLKGIGYGCDEEVIRLIKQGPKWSPTKQNNVSQAGKVKVRLRFKLPAR